jgi:hypothetical protein
MTDDELDGGCDIDAAGEPDRFTPDGELDAVVLFAGVDTDDPAQVAAQAAAWAGVFG